MQRPLLPEFIVRNPRAGFVLPDTALVEMSKSDRWEYTFRRNLAPLHTIASRCFMSVSVQDARGLELAHGRSCHSRLLPEDFTQLLRDIIQGSQAPGGNGALARIQVLMPSLRQEFFEHDLNASTAKEELVARVGEIRQRLPPEAIRACRDPQRGRLTRVVVARSLGDTIYQEYMKGAGAPLAVAERIKAQQGMCLRWCYMLAHNALHWAADGGIEPAKEKVVLNDTLDQDYVLIGSFFSGVISLEDSVNKALVDLLAMLRLPAVALDNH